MFCPCSEEDRTWLERHCERLRAGDLHGYRDAEDFRRLASHVVGCNLVMDLVDLCELLLAHDTEVLACEVTFAAAATWLDQYSPTDKPPGPEERFQLNSDEAAFWIKANDPYPWRRMTRWLTIEAILRLLSHANRDMVRHFVFPEFQESLQGDPNRFGPDLHSLCTQRSGPVVKAFRAWWQAAVPRFTACLRKVWEDSEDFLADNDDEQPRRRQRLTERIALSLGDTAPELAILVSQKYSQLQGCLRRLKSAVPEPCPGDWFRNFEDRLHSSLPMAEGQGRDFKIDEKDRGNLEKLLDLACDALTVGEPFRTQRRRRMPVLAQLVSSTAPAGVVARLGLGWSPRVSAANVKQLVQEWIPIARLVRTRGLPDDWLELPHLGDFLHGEVPFSLDVDAWYRRTDGYWAP